MIDGHAEMENISIDGKVYEMDNLSDEAKMLVQSHKFTNENIETLQNQLALLNKAKKSYLESIHREIISKKSGFLFDENF